MNFKNKAGLALALAAIFTAAGANAAVADYDITGAVDSMRQGEAQLNANVGTVGDGIAILNTDDILLGADGPLTLSMSNYTIALDALDLVGANNVTSLTINNNNQAVNIGAVNIAGNGGALFTSNGKAIESVAVHGALTLGTDGASKSPGGSLVDLLVDYTGLLFSGIPVLNVHGGAFDITGSLSVLDGDVNVGSLFDDFSASLNVHNLKMDDNSTFSVDAGFGSSRGQAAIGSFGDVGSTALADTAINVRLLVTQNGTLTVGLDNSQWIDSVIAALDGTTPFNTWTVDGTDSGLTAAFGLFSPQRLLLSNSGIGIGINASLSPDTFVAFAHSLTAINLTDVDANTAAFSMVDGNGASAAFTTVAIGGQTGNTATIYLDNAAAGKDYKIFDNVHYNNISIGGNALSGNKVLTDADLGEYWNYNAGTMVFSSGLLEGSWEVVKGDANSDLLLHVTRNNVEVKDIFSTMSGGMASMVDQLYTAGENSNAADNAGIRFVSRATDIMYMPNRAEAAKILEGAAQIAVAAGAPAVTGNVIGKMASVVVNHNDMLGGSQPAYGNRPGQGGPVAHPLLCCE